jgi:polyisoprenoid-binding protein YceI
MRAGFVAPPDSNHQLPSPEENTMTRHRLIALVAATAIAVPFVFAAQDQGDKQRGSKKHSIDPVHTSVWFKINHLGVADFYGRFNDVSGTLTIDQDDPTQSALEVAIKVASIDTANADRDKHLKSEEYFNVEKHPQITFKSKSFKAAGDKTWQVAGELTMLGKTRPLTIELKQTGTGKDPWGNVRVGIATEFKIKRTDFGMDAAVGMLGDEVTLIVSAECIQQ